MSMMLGGVILLVLCFAAVGVKHMFFDSDYDLWLKHQRAKESWKKMMEEK